MGRGRQKAKHTKVARELKYFSPNTNYNALERELTHPSDAEPDYEDKWADTVAAPEPDEADDSADDLYVDRWAVDTDDDAPESKSA
ncbi:DUF3073 domain-containing protein [Marisediminicola sp. LYQ134]|uniref:DUF3073 domain-containing protein n=1 Tax=unclassified Marisediminicola TaxID=2618316 RepID=UPI0039834784